jgi:hypothetical protein
MTEFAVAMHEMRGEMLIKNNQDVQAFIDAAHILLKAKGWKYEGQSLQSALYHREYKQGDMTVTLTGWHGGGKPGTSRFYGAAKSLLYVYLSKGFKIVSKIEADLHDCGTFQELISRQETAMDAALKFIAKV